VAKIYKLFSNVESHPRTHDLESANDLLPLIRKYTEAAIQETQRNLLKIRQFKRNSPDFKRLSRAHEEAIGRWVERVHRLGGLAKGLWLVDFDTGDGCLCWIYPETRVEHFHGYNEAYKDRRKVKASDFKVRRTQT